MDLDKNKLNVIFFGVHPDDVELTCGGTAIKLVRSGKKTGVVDLTRGELSTRGNLASRKKETDCATKALGIETRENLGLKDGNILNDVASRRKVITVIRKYRPEIIFAPYPGDRHPDHINGSNLIREAVFYSGLRRIKTGSLEAYRPKRVFYYPQAYDIPVSFIIDISSEFDAKMEALACYGTQFYTPGKKKTSGEPETFISNENFYKVIEARARMYGFKIGTEFGEAYFSYEAVKVSVSHLFEI